MVGLGRLYTVSFAAQTLALASGDYDLFEIVPATNKLILLEAMYVKNVGTDVKDAEEEMLRWSIVRGNTTSGSGGGTPTPAPLALDDTAASFTAESMNTTPASTAGVTLHEDGWNVRVGLEWVPPPEHRVLCSAASSRICVRSSTTVADDVTVSGTLYVRELS